MGKLKEKNGFFTDRKNIGRSPLEQGQLRFVNVLIQYMFSNHRIRYVMYN